MIKTTKILLLIAVAGFFFLSAIDVGASGADDAFDQLDEEFAEPEPVPPKVIIKKEIIVIEKEVLVPAPATLPPENAPTRKPSTRGRMVVSNGYRFDLQSCTLSNRNVECDVMVKTPDNDKTLLLYSNYSFYKLSSSVFDNLGNQYYATSTLLGNKDSRSNDNRSITGRLIQGVPTKIKVFFENVSSETSSISLLELHAEDNGKRFKVQFRNISFPG